jgi:Protein of unknown function (DUF3551)
LIDNRSLPSLICHFRSGLKAKNQREQETMMKEFLKATTAPAAALLAAFAFGAMTTPDASAAEFCRRDVTGHMTGCGFDSMEQCQAASAGIGGDCFRDPSLSDSNNAYAYHPASSRAKRGSPAAGKAANPDQ